MPLENRYDNIYDIIIIGGGPNGIYCLNTINKCFPDKTIGLIEKSTIVNNIKQYPNILWHNGLNALCFDSENKNINRNPTTKEVINYYENYFINNNLKFIKNEVIDIINNEDIYKIVLKDNELLSKYVIISTGIYENIKYLNIKTDYPYIKYSFIDLETKNKNLVLVGGGNSAIDYVINLLPFNKITWIIRGKYCKNSAHLNKLREIMKKYNHNLFLYENTIIQEFYENNTLKLSNGININNIDHCNILIGYSNISNLITKLGIENNGDIINIDNNYQTSRKNIFVFGSISSQTNDIVYIHNGNPHRLKNIINFIKNN